MSSYDSRQQRERERSRKIREMAQSIKNSFSVASSTGSNHGTISPDSTFNPAKDDEVFMSTGLMDYDLSAKLPQLRDTAKKYGKWQPKSKPEIIINTSAIGRAFPDFTSGSTSSSISMEFGRGWTSSKRLDGGATITDPEAKLGPDLLSSPVRPAHLATRTEEYKEKLKKGKDSKQQQQQPQPKSSILDASTKSTQSKQQQHSRPTSPILEALHNGRKDIFNTTPSIMEQEKENIAPTTTKSFSGSPYTSYASRTVSGERRTITELHARVANESDASFIGEDRPTTVTFEPQGRFVKAQQQTTQQSNISLTRSVDISPLKEQISSRRQSQPIPKQPKASAMSVDASLRMNNPPVHTRRAHTSTGASRANHAVAITQSSFIVPPPSTQGTQTLNIRPYTQQGRVETRSRNYGPVDGFEVPQEEENIYEMVDRLREQVRDLAMQRDQAVEERDRLYRAVEELRIETHQVSATCVQLESDCKALQNEAAQREIYIQTLTEENRSIQAKVDHVIRMTQEDTHDTHTQVTIRSSRNVTRQDETISHIMPDIQAAQATQATSSKSVIRASKRVTGDPDATIRPAMDPIKAQEMVIESIEEELEHLKEEHCKIQKAYVKHDAAIGKRKRLALKERLDALGSEIEKKSEQLYMAYDALEGLDEEDLPWEGIDEP